MSCKTNSKQACRWRFKPFIWEMRLREYKSTVIDKGLNYFISVKLLILVTNVSPAPVSTPNRVRRLFLNIKQFKNVLTSCYLVQEKILARRLNLKTTRTVCFQYISIGSTDVIPAIVLVFLEDIQLITVCLLKAFSRCLELTNSENFIQLFRKTASAEIGKRR